MYNAQVILVVQLPFTQVPMQEMKNLGVEISLTLSLVDLNQSSSTDNITTDADGRIVEGFSEEMKKTRCEKSTLSGHSASINGKPSDFIM